MSNRKKENKENQVAKASQPSSTNTNNGGNISATLFCMAKQFVAHIATFFSPQKIAVPEKSHSALMGLWGEKIAADFLKANGYSIIAKRVKNKHDELDIIAKTTVGAKREEMLVFVEVKTRSSELLNSARASMNKRKRHALCRAASHYLRKLPPTPFRFDLIEVIGEMESPTPPVIRHHKNAFPMEHRIIHNGLHNISGAGRSG